MLAAVDHYDAIEFLTALRTVATGGIELDPQVTTSLVSRLASTERLAGLTPRERDVLGLMARGLSNSAIDGEIVVTEGAVNKYINRIFAKLGLPPTDSANRRVLAVRHFLDDADPGR